MQPELRERRSPVLFPTLAGYCRRCGGPIVVPEGKTKAAALPDWRELGLVSLPPDPALLPDFLRDHPRGEQDWPLWPLGARLYRKALWHPWCDEEARALWNGSAAAQLLKNRDPRCAECGLDLERLDPNGPLYHQLRRACQEVAWSLAEGDARYYWQSKLLRWLRDAWIQGLRGLGFDWRRALGEADHVVPLWAGGAHEIDNLQLLCQVCHRAKSGRESRQRSRARRAAKGADGRLG